MFLSAHAGMGAACFCHPFDVVRVQMQVDAGGHGVLGTVQSIVRNNGARGLYNGLTAAFLRQWMYGSGRMGIFSFLMQDHKAKHGAAPNVFTKLCFGVTSGGIGSFIGTPSEVAIVRMAADSKAPLEKRKNYRNVVDCLRRTYQEEGVAKGLYKGATVTVIRAMFMGGFQMGVYSETKERLLAWDKEGKYVTEQSLGMMVTASLHASLWANFASLPFDVIKSRIQNMPTENPPYTGMVDCFKKSVASEGVLVLWKGFTPAFVKLAPYTVLSLTFLEKLTYFATGKSAL
jgi:solute carrier family 25 oxoglutarate transporter 11